LQLKTETGAWLYDTTAAMTLAVALRDSLAEAIGVQATELGCAIKEARPNHEAVRHSILIFDRYAAGYASSAERYLGSLFQRARQRLTCPADCDSACPHCVLDFDQRFAADSLDRHAALDVLSDTWINSLRLPDDYAYFGATSRAEYRHLAEAVWNVATRQGAGGLRFYTGGAPETWDIGPSPLRELAYRLAGHGVNVEIMVPGHILEVLDDADRYLLASLADHPKISLRAQAAPARCGQGWLLAETLTAPCRRWAIGEETALAFGPDWGRNEGPLVMAEQDTLPLQAGEALTAETIRPRLIEQGDREIEIHHELDGPLQGFGMRFWQCLADLHAATNALLADQDDDVTALFYRDRYLFTPLSVALLAEVVSGLRERVGQERWALTDFAVTTTNRRVAGDNPARNTIWADWPHTDIRDQALRAAFRYLGVDASIHLADGAATGHGRLLEVEWASGRKLTLRLDQGVSYWRAAHSNSRQACHFNLNPGEVELRGKQLAELAVGIEGARLPTQLFLKVR